MRKSMRFSLALGMVAPLAAAGLVAAAGTAQAITFKLTYTIADWGAFTVGTSRASAFGQGLNVNGYGVGEAYYTGGTTHAVQFANGKLTDLGALTATDDSHAYGVNDSDRIVGIDYPHGAAGYATYPVEWVGGKIKKLDGNVYGRAIGINDASDAVGAIYLNPNPSQSYPQQAVEFANGRTIPLFGITNGLTPVDSAAIAINNSAVIVGAQLTTVGQVAAVRFSNTRGVAGYAYPGLAGYGDNEATAVGNQNNEVVGYATNADNRNMAAEYVAGHPAIALGTLTGDDNSEALSVDSAGIATGYAWNSVTQVDTAVMFASGNVINLNAALPPNSGWQLEQADSINDVGQISGVGEHNGVFRAFTMTPHITPSPGPGPAFLHELLILIGLLPHN